jgi:hypothetical protein
MSLCSWSVCAWVALVPGISTEWYRAPTWLFSTLVTWLIESLPLVVVPRAPARASKLGAKPWAVSAIRVAAGAQ